METHFIITMELRGLSREQNAVLPCIPYVSSDPAFPNWKCNLEAWGSSCSASASFGAGNPHLSGGSRLVRIPKAHKNQKQPADTEGYELYRWSTLLGKRDICREPERCPFGLVRSKVMLWISVLSLNSHWWMWGPNLTKKETFEFILKTFNPKGILISQPAHMDTGKSSNLDSGRGKAET